ncbi:MAG: hypothetical protein ACPIE8_07475, partial [Henriciella sp.]
SSENNLDIKPSLKNQKIQKEIIEKDIVLETCPTSNIAAWLVISSGVVRLFLQFLSGVITGRRVEFAGSAQNRRLAWSLWADGR